MSFDKTAFKSIYEELVFSNNAGSSDIADNLIQLGLLLGQSSLALKHSSETTCTIQEENLQNYRNTVNKEIININVQKGGFRDIGDDSLNPDEYEEYLNLPCRGEFLDCNNDTITKEEIEDLFKTTPEVHNSQGSKRGSSAIASAEQIPPKKFVYRDSNSVDAKCNESNSKLYSLFNKPNKSPNRINVTMGREIDKSDTLKDTSESNDKLDRSSLYLNKNVQQQSRQHSSNDQPLFSFNKSKKTNEETPPREEKQQNRQNSIQSNGQPLFSFDKTRKTVESEAERHKQLNSFISARDELHRQNLLKNGQNPNQSSNTPQFSYGTSTKTLGCRRKFVPPIQTNDSNQMNRNQTNENYNNDVDERLKNIEPKMVELIRSEIMVQSNWDDIAGLEYAKTTIQEAVVWPLLRPDIFTGLRGPPRGILLFGPPGTGKTLIGRCIAAKSKSTFFSISASSLTSKWIGEGEKMVRTLFAVAAVHQPSVIFIDEIDSLLSQRSDTEHESSRRLKTEFLVQLDGARTSDEEKILIVGATNRPQELDEAARRRFTKRLYIPLPELDARTQILTSLLKKERNLINVEEVSEIGRLSDGFSGADMKTLCHEALMGPIRAIRMDEMHSINVNDVRQVNFSDFTNALKRYKIYIFI